MPTLSWRASMAAPHSGLRPSAEAAAEDEWFMAAGCEAPRESLDVFDPLGEHEAGASSHEGGVDVSADLVGTAFLVDELGEDLLDTQVRPPRSAWRCRGR